MIKVKGFLVEEFGRVNANQSHALNFHLNCTLDQFDQAYQERGGKLGSPEHLRDRTDYASSLALDLLALYRHDDSNIKMLETKSEILTPSGPILELVSHSEFDGVAGPAAGTRGSPFPAPWQIKLARWLTGPRLS